MATTHWGRKETIIFPPHSPIYSYGAVFLALVLTGCFVYLRFNFGQTPLQQFYTPIYARSAAGGAFNVCDGVDISWRRFTSDLADRLGFPRARISMPYAVAYVIGAGLERGYRAARVRTGVSLRPLLSRQAVQVLGREQSFSNRRLREQLGWEPRVDYEDAMDVTVAWLQEEYL